MIKDLSKKLAFPMIIVSIYHQTLSLFDCFVLGVLLWLLNHLLPYIHYSTFINSLQRSALSVIAIISMGYGIDKLFFTESQTIISCTFIVIGFYLLALEEDLFDEKEIIKLRKLFPLLYINKF